MATQAMTNYFPSCVSPWLQAGMDSQRVPQVEDPYQQENIEQVQVCPNPEKYSQVIRSPIDSNVEAHLQDIDVWKQFSSARTEMIVTKPGRRIFPGYRVKFSGLNPDAQYCVLMDVVNIDEHRYKFQNGEWIVSGRGEPKIPQKFYIHPKSPSTGRKLMNEILTFHKVKLTNSFAHSGTEKFNVHSMHRYQLRVHIVRTDDVRNIKHEPMSTFGFSQTNFFTVTAYQNHEVTKLKIANNPFARGFRCDGGKTKNSRRFSGDVLEYTGCDVTEMANKRLKVGFPQQNNFTSSYSGYSSFQPIASAQTVNQTPQNIFHSTPGDYISFNAVPCNYSGHSQPTDHSTSSHPVPYRYFESAQSPTVNHQFTSHHPVSNNYLAGSHNAGVQQVYEYGNTSPYSDSPADEYLGNVSPNIRHCSSQPTPSPECFETGVGNFFYPPVAQEFFDTNLSEGINACHSSPESNLSPNSCDLNTFVDEFVPPTFASADLFQFC